MNAKQRYKNRQTSHTLNQEVRYLESLKHTCEECGEPGYHGIRIRGSSLEAIMTGVDDQQGFWTCSKFYDPVTKRRLDT